MRLFSSINHLNNPSVIQLIFFQSSALHLLGGSAILSSRERFKHRFDIYFFGTITCISLFTSSDPQTSQTSDLQCYVQCFCFDRQSRNQELNRIFTIALSNTQVRHCNALEQIEKTFKSVLRHLIYCDQAQCSSSCLCS